MQQKFFENRKALIVLIAASLVVLVSMGVRQTWGLFYQFFENDLGINRTQFGFAIGVQIYVRSVFNTVLPGITIAPSAKI